MWLLYPQRSVLRQIGHEQGQEDFQYRRNFLVYRWILGPEVYLLIELHVLAAIEPRLEFPNRLRVPRNSKEPRDVQPLCIQKPLPERGLRSTCTLQGVVRKGAIKNFDLLKTCVSLALF